MVPRCAPGKGKLDFCPSRAGVTCPGKPCPAHPAALLLGRTWAGELKEPAKPVMALRQRTNHWGQQWMVPKTAVPCWRSPQDSTRTGTTPLTPPPPNLPAHLPQKARVPTPGILTQRGSPNQHSNTEMVLRSGNSHPESTLCFITPSEHLAGHCPTCAASHPGVGECILKLAPCAKKGPAASCL